MKKKQDIPIFDSLTHPTIDGDWMLPEYSGKNNISNLLSAMHENNIKWAFAVGMKGIGGYDEQSYIQFIQEKAGDSLFPIAFFDVKYFSDKKEIDTALKRIKNMGYYGIKLHPRIGNFNLSDSILPYVIEKANELQLVVLLCTYFYDDQELSLNNTMDNIRRLLVKVPKQRTVLLHGGTVKLLEMMEVVRSFPNVLLDLSFTLCRYEKSSIDIDIQYLFKNFDQRICVGSDSPQFSQGQLRERFDFFAKEVSLVKASNIAYINLINFLGLSL